MKNEKETMITPEAEEAAKKHIAEIANDPAPVTDAELDDEFSFTLGSGRSIDADQDSSGEPVFPGPRVKREPFTYKGELCHSYKTIVPMNVFNSKGEQLKKVMECDFKVADKYGKDSYAELESLYRDLPEGQDYFKLGFIYNEFRNQWSYCVQVLYDDIPVRVSIVPRDEQSRNNMKTIIVYLQKKGLLEK